MGFEKVLNIICHRERGDTICLKIMRYHYPLPSVTWQPELSETTVGGQELVQSLLKVGVIYKSS